MSQQDRAFMTSFAVVLAVLVVIAFIFYFLANVASGVDGDQGPNPRMEAKILENIAPVTNVQVGAAAPAGAAASAPRSGADVYAAACAACHNTGVAGAPKSGDKGAWGPRAANGMDSLLANATNGLNAMPPMGTCADCSQDELRGAIAHILKETGIEVAGADAAAAAPAAEPAPAQTAAADSGKGKEVYNAACMACHSTGAAGAPKTGDKAAWAPRIDKGMDTLLANAISGINAMPPKGTCFACSDDDLKAAIDYMVAESK